MPATDHKRNVFLNIGFAKKRRKQMPFEMIDRQIGPGKRDSETFRDRGADHERTGQSRSRGRSKRVDPGNINLCITQRAIDQTRRVKEMVPRGYLRHYSAVFLVLRDLGSDLAG